MDAADNTLAATRSSFAERMSELRAAAGLSYRQLAAAASTDPGYLHKLASGERPPPSTAIAKALDDALEAGGELADLARREALPAPRPTPAGPLGDDDAAKARDTVNHLVALDTLHGSNGLVPLAVRTFRAAADQLAVVGGTPDVRSAVADLGAAAAWITADAVDRDQSKGIALEALAQADLAGDTRMHRFLLSHLSMVSEHASRYADALAYADRALVEQPRDPRVRAMFQVRRARALSGLGAPREALDALDRAAHLLTETPITDDGLTYWIHDAELAVHRAVILGRGGDPTAVEWSQRGIELLPPGQGRDQVLWRAMLLEDAVTARAWREIPAIVDDLMRFAGDTRSARVPEVLGRAWRKVAARRAPAAVRDAVRAARDAFPVA